MTIKLPLLTTEAGIKHEWIDNEDGTYTILSSQDVEDQLEYAKAQANENSGWSGDKTFRRAAHIPTMIWLKWLTEEGWDAYHPGNFDRLKRKLNDPDWRYLRTAHWRM